MMTMRDLRIRHKAVALLLAGLLFALGALPALAREPASEDAVKAAMLYNFVQFVRWPEAAAPTAGQGLVLGILGRDSLQEKLLDLAAETGRQVSARTLYFDSLQELKAHKQQLQVLYIGRSAQKDMAAILKTLNGAPVLTVCDDELFVKQGGMMNFVRHNSRIRFDLNLDATRGSRLKISSRLYGLARRIVKGGKIQEGR